MPWNMVAPFCRGACGARPHSRSERGAGSERAIAALASLPRRSALSTTSAMRSPPRRRSAGSLTAGPRRDGAPPAGNRPVHPSARHADDRHAHLSRAPCARALHPHLAAPERVDALAHDLLRLHETGLTSLPSQRMRRRNACLRLDELGPLVVCYLTTAQVIRTALGADVPLRIGARTPASPTLSTGL